ncbi:exodeoxyribonuclease V subunit beta [Oceanobacter sp. 3_MG-2023]|uniref:exodeoxyribonuclease V subunit beta n=1 Tax=Oceanobacter sp. 3_MG-2023 TaxID=3062622 RepID=UPI00273435D7|nr:exodeoxyribonuclease V subunit beta [Oceanobacter sp. 3_MG-2023]MDP2507100.1 exodeoxyribonuclease V subunit beta [Oceanobacter sp. 3_MG-2023]
MTNHRSITTDAPGAAATSAVAAAGEHGQAGVNPLDISTFPLLGQSLIEASAGTGKTYTIASLYSRLLIGHHTGLGQLSCDQVLVVTFTNAATEELRGRIRERIRHNFEDVVRLRGGQPVDDALFGQWLAQLALDDEGLQRLATWLQANLARMDDASIFTIHGFCQRMLKQFAFDTGVMFSAELVLDADQYLRQACEDVWRRGLYHQQILAVEWLSAVFPTPADLMSTVRHWFARPDARFIPSPTSGQVLLPEDWQDASRCFEQVGELWQQLGDQHILELLQSGDLNGNSYRKGSVPGWIRSISQYFSGHFSFNVPDKLGHFGTEMLRAKTKKNGTTPEHPLFDQIQQLLDTLQPYLTQLDQLRSVLPVVWFEEVKARYITLLEQAGAMSPDDLLRLLDVALQGPMGQALAEQIRSLYPVALIDEFQDTDPLQYRIFATIYPAESDSAEESQEYKAPVSGNDRAASSGSTRWGLTAIGDPKQAIYAFRGADIFTYIGARRAMKPERIFTLDTNWRSHSDLVADVNDLFAQHPAPFVFDEDIPFHPVKAAGKADDRPLRLMLSGAAQSQAPLQIWLDEVEENRDQGVWRCAQQCASSIRALLTGTGQIGDQPVLARDMAVLVRSHKQAQIMKKALSRVGVGAVFLSRDSVFRSLEASELLTWLAAIAEPANERAVRNALATSLQGFSSEQLHQLLIEEAAWEQQLAQIQGYHDCWLRRGIMASLMRWLNDNDRAVRLRQLADGERILTNLLHLGELLQQASRRLRGHQALLRWFTEQVLDASGSGDEAQLRLETDDNLVSIVTIHKSKGLEYPLVFLPFLWSDSYTLRPQARSVQYFDEAQGVVVNLAPDKDARAMATRDSKAEMMRLLYVALTRPVQGCFIWLSAAMSRKTRVLDTSALGELLQTTGVSLDALCHSSGEAVRISPWPHWPDGDRPLIPVAEQLPVAMDFSRPLYQRWRVSSFTALSYHADGGRHDGVGLLADVGNLRLDETDHGSSHGESGSHVGLTAEDTNGSTGQLTAEWRDNPFITSAAISFPRGPQAGTCLHRVLERWDFHSRESLIETILPTELGHFGLLQQDVDLPALADWLMGVVQTPLDSESGLSLAALETDQRLDEMEFCLPIGELRSGSLNRLLIESGQDAEGIRRPQLEFSAVTGYLKGFIDLVFCYQGRYYLADYKSNYLGDQRQDYTGVALQQSMVEHHYDLQAWIYILALDQFLRQRLPDYSPQQHLGGVYYLFLRGMGDADSAAVAASGPWPGVYLQTIDWAQLQHWQQRLLRPAGSGFGIGADAGVDVDVEPDAGATDNTLPRHQPESASARQPNTGTARQGELDL